MTLIFYRFYMLLICISLIQVDSTAQDCNDPPPTPAPCQTTFMCDINRYCIDMGNVPWTVGYPNFPNCELQNPHWFAFVGDGNVNIINITVVNCRGGDESFQATVYTGQPFCNQMAIYGLETVAGNCDCYGPGDDIQLEFPTISGQTYYLAMDGCSGALCEADILFQPGGNAPEPDQPEPPEELNIPDFEDGPADTVCLGASGVEMEVPYIPPATTHLLWEFPDGTVLEGIPDFTSLEIPDQYFQQEGPLEVCVSAANACDTSDPACRQFYVKEIAPVYETATICEGDDFSWDVFPIETDDPGVYNYTAERYSTYGCPYQANLELTVTNENDENPTRIEDVICWGEVYTHPSGYSTAAGANNYTYVWEGVNPGNCDSFFRFDIEVVGGQFIINPPDTCNGNGTISLQSLFLPIGNNVPLSDPDLTVDYSWTVNGQPLEDTTQSIIIDQEMLEDNPYGNYEMEVSMDYPSVNNTCSFSTNVFEMRLEDYVPRFDSISGPNLICEGNRATYSVHFQDPENDYFIDDVDTFNWNTPDGVSVIDSGTHTITVEVAPGADEGNICVELITGCGFRDSGCFPLNIESAIVPELGSGGNPCSHSFSFSPIEADTGKWLVGNQPANATATFADNNDPATSVNVDSTGSYQFIWREGQGKCAQRDTVEVTFNGMPELENVSVKCNDPPTTYTVSFEISGGTPPYQLISGSGTITGNEFVSDPISSGSNYMFQIEDASGCVTDIIEGIKVCDCETDAGTMAGESLEACEDECLTALPQSDEVLDSDDVVQFALHEGSGNSLQNPLQIGDDPEFCFQAGMTYGEEYYISRIVGSDDGNGAVDLNDGCLSVAEGQTVVWYEQPEANAGPDSVSVCGMNTQFNAVPSAGEGEWIYLSGPGNAIIDMPNNANSTVNIDAFGTYIFSWSETNQGCSDVDSVQITFLDPPEIEDGSLVVECLPNLDYVITFDIVGGTIPYDLTGGAGDLNGTTYVDTLSSGELYDIMITDAENCGPLSLQGRQDCECNSEAGSMAAEALDTCFQECVTASHVGMENVEQGDTTAFVLHDAPGNQLGSVIGMNGSGRFCYSDYASQIMVGETYYISFVVGNDDGTGMVDLVDPCLAVAPGQAVVFTAGPQVDAGSDSETCGLTFGDLRVTQPEGTGAWSLYSGPGNAIFGMPTQKETTVTVDQTGKYCFIWTGSHEGCRSRDTVCVDFLDAPRVDPATIEFECNALNTEYTVTFQIEGGDPSTYDVSGDPGTLNGNVFTADPIQSGASFTFLVSDGNDCDTFTLSDSHMCDCSKEAGMMSLDTVSACPGDTISVPPAQNPTLDAGDISRYVLHEGSGNVIENEIARNGDTEFGFDPNVMNLDQVYYISNIVGSDNGEDEINPDDACIDISPGTPVIWYSPPTAGIEDFEEITCEQPVVSLDGSLSTSTTGQGLDYSWNTVDGNLVGGVNSPVASVDRPGMYSLIITDLGSGCVDSTSVAVEVSEDAPLATIEEPELLTCDRPQVTLDAQMSSTGADYEVEWTSEPSGLVDNPNVLDPEVDAPGLYILTVTKLSNGCTSTDSVRVEIDKEAPMAKASVENMLSCNVQSVHIEGSGSSTGTDYLYTWTPSDGLDRVDTLNPVAFKTGTYTLIVTDTTNGCTAMTTVSVERDTSLVEIDSYTSRNPNCEGDQTGFIQVTGLPGGQPPFTYSLNSGQEVNQTGMFQNLGPGLYEVIAKGAKGCRYLIDSIRLIEPKPLSVNLPTSVEIDHGDQVVLQPDISPEGRTIEMYQWESSDTLQCDTCPSVTVSPDETTDYVLTVVDENGCTVRVRTIVVVEITRDVYIPNVFSPNDDGINDVFYLFSKEERIEKISSMQIFDRWGNRVFEQKDIQPNDKEVGWKGRRGGQRLNPGVFVYVFEVVYFDGETKQLKGSVTLIR